jgi:hypothetical protein
MFFVIAPPPWLKVFALDTSGGATIALGVGTARWSWEIPALLELAMVAVMGAGMLVVAILAFNKTE